MKHKKQIAHTAKCIATLNWGIKKHNKTKQKKERKKNFLKENK